MCSWLTCGPGCVQANAIGSILEDPHLLDNPLVVREAFLGFQQQGHNRRRALLDEATKVCVLSI